MDKYSNCLKSTLLTVSWKLWAVQCDSKERLQGNLLRSWSGIENNSSACKSYVDVRCGKDLQGLYYFRTPTISWK